MEELTIEKIKIYAEKRAYKAVDYSDQPSDINFNSDRMWKWQEKKQAEVELLRLNFLKDFDQLPIETQCKLLKDYVKDSTWYFRDAEELEDVLAYLKRRHVS